MQKIPHRIHVGYIYPTLSYINQMYHIWILWVPPAIQMMGVGFAVGSGQHPKFMAGQLGPPLAMGFPTRNLWSSC